MKCTKTRNVVSYYNYICLFTYCGCVVFFGMKLEEQKSSFDNKQSSNCTKGNKENLRKVSNAEKSDN